MKPLNAAILKRLETALNELENMEHRVKTLIEGNRSHQSELIHSLKIRELRRELQDIAAAIREDK